MMGFFKALFNVTSEILEEQEKEKRKNLERECDLYNLDEYEREEVRKGSYEPYNFEDSEDVELDDDDYYQN